MPCAALTGLSLPGLPGPDTATVSANEVSGSGCQVAIEITDTSDPRGGQPGDIGIDLTLPDSWNGNYMAEGNGVYCSPAGFVTLASDQWLAAGYVISQDDCGHTGYPNPLISPWVTNSSPPPALNWNRIDDFGYLAQHLTAVESKVVIDQYYDAGAHYSFWNGCSTGGRQGLMEAQRYPRDFNGILAGAPALNWPQFIVAQMWPQLVMEWNNDYLPTCKEDLVTRRCRRTAPTRTARSTACSTHATATCSAVLDNLIGTVTPCDTFTKTDALVVQEIWQGPRYSGSVAQFADRPARLVWDGTGSRPRRGLRPDLRTRRRARSRPRISCPAGSGPALRSSPATTGSRSGSRRTRALSTRT